MFAIMRSNKTLFAVKIRCSHRTRKFFAEKKDKKDILETQFKQQTVYKQRQTKKNSLKMSKELIDMVTKLFQFLGKSQLTFEL